MNLKRAKVDGKMCDVINLEELHDNIDLYKSGSVGIQISKDNEQYVLPYKQSIQYTQDTVLRPGVYPLGNIGEVFVFPEDDIQYYQPEIIDFSDTKSMEEYLLKQGRLKNIEKEILTTQDNIFKPPVSDNDTPEMKALKLAIAQKNIDIDKYAGRFGENFPNDKRKMKDDKISLLLLKRIGEALDMNIQIKISDANPNVPNPMGNPIVVQLTTPNGSLEENEE